MGLVLAIFCFIIGIPMFLGGLGLIAVGYQENKEAVEEQTKVGKGFPYCSRPENANHSGCVKLFEDQQKEVDQNENMAISKIVGGGILALFASLIMWGGYRTRRPKEVRIRRD